MRGLAPVGMAGVLALVAGCGGAAAGLDGEYRVARASLTIRDEFDGEFNQPPSVTEETFTADDAGTMTFSATPTAPGARTFTRALTKVFDRVGLSEADRVIDVDPPQVIAVGYDLDGDEDGIFLYDAADEWNGNFSVTGGLGGATLEKALLFEFSPTQRQLNTFTFELAR